MSVSRVLGLMVVSAWLAAGCSSTKKIDVGGACILNSDCNGSLVCTSGLCHVACRASTDCSAGQSCMKTSDSAVCVLPAEVTCSATSSCKNSLLCAPDQHCRTACISATNCTTNQVCASNFCADPNDPDLVNGQIPPTAAPDAGTFDTLSPDLPAVSPADAPPVTGPEAGVTYDASLDAPAGPDAPAGLLDAEPDVAPDLALPGPEAGPACTSTCDDGLFCTTDTCVAGICKSTLKSGYCVIDKACYRDGDTKPGDTCQACTAATSTSLWTPEPEGALCGTGKSCQSHVCTACGVVGQACCGTATPRTCVVGAACNTSTNQCQVDKAIDISGTEDTICALLQSGSVRCWGTNGPMMGAATGSNVAAPPIAGLQDAVNISVGYGTACAVRATGAVVCWGSALTGGALVPGITNATQVSAGPHTCVRTADSKVLCWGTNSYGELGLGTTSTITTSTPQEMSGVTDAQSVAACGGATCVLRKAGQVSCTGNALENGQSGATSTITDLPAASSAVSLSCSVGAYDGQGGSFWAVTQNATLLTWGSGQASPGNALGVGQVVSATWARNYYSGASSYLAIQEDKTLWSVGNNGSGQLGDGTFTSATAHTSPRLIHSVSPVSNVVAVAAAWATIGNEAACLLRTDGSVSCGGENGGSPGTAVGDGQQSPQAPRAYFVPVVGILPVASEDGQCYDGVDNDGDGKTDLDDSDCAQDLGSATGNNVATVSFTGVFGNYLKESCNNTGYGGPEAVLTWTAPSGGSFQFDTTGSSFDTVLAAYKGNPLTSAELACNDDGPTLLNGASAIQVKVVAGDKLTLVVDSKAAPTGPASFTLNITKQ